MSKLQKCLYLIDLLERRGPMNLKEINEHYRYSSLYDGDIQPRTFLRYNDYILLNFPCYIEFNAATQKYYLIKNDYNKGNQSLYEYLLSAFHIEGMSELAIKHRDRIMLTDSPTGIENVQPILKAVDANKGIEFDYWSFNKQTKKRLVAIPYFLRTWERRWYLVAVRTEDYEILITLSGIPMKGALDLIMQDDEQSEENFWGVPKNDNC